MTETISNNNKLKRFFNALIITVLTVSCLLVGMVSFSIPSKALDINADYISSLGNTVLLWKEDSTGSCNLQSLVDDYFCENALNGNVQTYVQALTCDPYNNPDLSAYTRALAQSVEAAYHSDSGIYPTSLQKSVITLCMCHAYSNAGTDIPFVLEDYFSEEIVNDALNNTIGSKGIMTYIYGLNMLEALEHVNAEYDCPFTCEDIIMTLISSQLSDGGYALSGDEGDVDVTAMTLRSLSYAYKALSTTDAASSYIFSDAEAAQFISSVDSSILFLKNAQLETGDYASYGCACSESTAQVILAACALGIDVSDFNNNNISALDGLVIYRLENGSFSHSSPLVTNDMASSQAYEALCAIASTLPVSSTASDASTNINDNTVNNSKTNNLATNGKVSIKTYFYIIVATAFIISVLIISIIYFKNKNRKKYVMQLISALLIATLAAAAIFFININTPVQFSAAPSSTIADAPGENTICISYRINCSTVESDPIKADIYPTDTLYVYEGATAFDVLYEICRTNNIQLDYESNSVYGTAYVKGINSLYEFDNGDLSGWMYRINGEFPSVGCGYYTLTEGDYVEWLYTTNIGRDLEND